jgi:hypothetical protein
MIKNIKKKVLRQQKTSLKTAKVYLEHRNRASGAGLFAKRRIQKGEVIAYYPVEVVRDPGPRTRDALAAYFIDVKHANGKSALKLTGRPNLSAILAAPTRHGIPSTGLFANEPAPHEVANAEIAAGPARPKLVEGLHLTYRLTATVAIEEGCEVLTCYGPHFNRGNPPYGTSCCCA